MFNFDIAGITPRDIENHNKTFNFNVKELFTGNSSGGGSSPKLITTGNCYFKTGYKINQDTEIRAIVTIEQTDTENRMVYADGTNIYLSSQRSSCKFGKRSVTTELPHNIRCTITHNKTGITYNDTTVAFSNVADFTSSAELALGAWSTAGASTFQGSYELFQIYQAGELVLDWRPHKDEEGIACFKDNVTGTNIYKSGSGNLEYKE